MWTTEYTLTTDAGPAQVWHVLSDVAGWGAWNAGIETISVDGPPGLGTTFRMRPTGQEELTSTIAAWEPERLISDVTAVDGLEITVEHRLTSPSGGGTTITYEVHVDAAGSGAPEEEIGTAISADFPQVMAALAAAASGATTPPRETRSR